MLYRCCSGHLTGEQIHLLSHPFLCLGGKTEKQNFYLSPPSCKSTVESTWVQRAGNTGKVTEDKEGLCARMQEEKEYAAGKELPMENYCEPGG